MFRRFSSCWTDKFRVIHIFIFLLGITAFGCSPTSLSPSSPSFPATAVAFESEQSAPLSYPPAYSPTNSPEPITMIASSPERESTLETALDNLGHLTITLKDDDDVMIECAQDGLKINGVELGVEQLRCSSITRVHIVGSSGNNNFNLSGLNRTTFPHLQEVIVDGGGGNDSFTASEFKDVLTGGNGDDFFIGTQPNDEVNPGAGQNFFMEATEPLGSSLNAPVEEGQ